MAAIKALIKPELLAWTRDRARVSREEAAKAAGVLVDTLDAWEAGADRPTLAQLRKLAAKYKFPLAVFYLQQPPEGFAPLRDFRRLPDGPEPVLSPALAYQIRHAHQRREIALELLQDLGEPPQRLPFQVTLDEDPEDVGRAIRKLLDVDDKNQQKGAKEAFSFWRRRLEMRDILVFVVSGPHQAVELSEMRGFAIARPELPVLVVNGKDYSQGGRAFTLLHEFCHVLLGESAISNGTGDDAPVTRQEQKIERFCNAVAAATLLPRDLLLRFDTVAPGGVRAWSDEDLRAIAQTVGMSREAVLLRLVAVGRASWDFYWGERDRFRQEYQLKMQEEEEKKALRIPYDSKLMNWNGRGYTRLVLRGYYDQKITLNDVSTYLGAKLQHIPKLEHAAFKVVSDA